MNVKIVVLNSGSGSQRCSLFEMDGSPPSAAEPREPAKSLDGYPCDPVIGLQLCSEGTFRYLHVAQKDRKDSLRERGLKHTLGLAADDPVYLLV